MLKRGYKLIISVVLILTLSVGLFSASSFAVVTEIVGGAGLLGSALGSLGVDLLAGGSATAATLGLWLNGDYSIRGTLTGVADGYIKVNDDSVIIDGVEYQSIFLDPSMAAELHTQAFDFITQKAIVSNDSGILATGVGYWDGVPMYQTNDGIFSQTYEFTVGDSFSVGNSSYVTGESVKSNYISLLINGSTAVNYHKPSSGSIIGQSGFFRWYSTSQTLNNVYKQAYSEFSDQMQTYGGLISGRGDSSAFTYSYVSGVIDADPLPSNYGFSAYLPKADLVAGNIVAGTYYNNDTAGLEAVNKLIDILDKAYGDETIENVEWAEEGQPVPPVPDTTIADTAYADLHAEMVDIKNNQAHANSAIDNIDTNVDVIGRTVDHLDEIVTDIEGYVQTGTSDIVDAVDTAGQTIEGKLDDIEGAIDTYGQSVVTEIGNVETAVDTAGQSVVDSVDAQTQALEESIADVADKVESLDTTLDQVIEKVESHPLDLFSAFLDRLTEIPVIKDLFDGIKQHVGIWHYVVEWLQCIGTFLSFFIGLFADVAYCMVVPIYACVAGAICLAFYKRFGR